MAEPPTSTGDAAAPETGAAPEEPAVEESAGIDDGAIWFKKDAFTQPDFDVDAYIVDLRRYVPLEMLRSQLDTHVSSLKTQLVELINADYNDFVSLSTQLVDVDGVVIRMRSALTELQGKLKGARQVVMESLAALEAGLQRRKQASQARATLELLQDTANVVSKVEKLLVELQQTELAGEGTDESRSRLLERIASEVNRLKFYSTNGANLPFVQQLEGRITAADETLMRSLDVHLRHGLASRDKSIIFHCLHAYAAVSDAAAAERVFKEVAVAPMVDRVIAEHKAQGAGAAGGGGAGGREQLAPIYQALAAGVRDDCAFIFELTNSAQSGLHAFSFLANAILGEVHARLADAVPGAFSPGVPAAFLANYSASLAFLDDLETHCTSRAEVAQLRASPAYASFLKRWNLSVYFTLQFQAIAGQLDQALAPAALPKASGEGAGEFIVAQSAALWECVGRCWAGDVFVGALAERFLKLTLQLVARYRTWLDQGVAARGAGTAEGHPGGEWGVAAGSDEVTLVLHDTELLAELVGGDLVATVLGRLAAHPAEAQDAARAALQEAAAALSRAAPSLTGALTATVSEACVQVLKQLRGITATYRMTNKPVPVRPSHYVASVLSPLRGFLDAEQAAIMSEGTKGALVGDVVAAVTGRYDEMAGELLTTLKKTEASLSRLKHKGKQNPAAAAGGMSDTDKICRQLFLDVEEYGRQLAKFGLDVSTFPPYAKLAETVREPEPAAGGGGAGAAGGAHGAGSAEEAMDPPPPAAAAAAAAAVGSVGSVGVEEAAPPPPAPTPPAPQIPRVGAVDAPVPPPPPPPPALEEPEEEESLT